MKSIISIIFLVIIQNTAIGQKWWRTAEKENIPSEIVNKTLIIELFELSEVHPKQAKVDAANKKLKKIVKRIYPYSFKFSDDNFDIDSNVLFLKSKTEVRTYSRGAYRTKVYYFYDPVKNKTYKPIQIYSSFPFKTLSMILRRL